MIKTEDLHIKMSYEKKEAVKRLAVKKKWTISTLVETALDEYIARESKKPQK